MENKPNQQTQPRIPSRVVRRLHSWLPLFALLLGGVLLFTHTSVAYAQSLQPQPIAAGTKSACVVTASGGVKCWGSNYLGVLGNGTTTDSTTPVNVVGLSNVVAVTAGGGKFCALTSSGGVKCWGGAYLGNSPPSDSSIPVQVTGLSSGVIAIAAHPERGIICVLMSSGTVKCWGENNQSWIGNGLGDTPADIAGLSGIRAIAVGGGTAPFLCALTNSGGVKCIGSGIEGGNDSAPADITGLTSGVTAISAGDSYACALINNGTVKCWGFNSYGQLEAIVSGVQSVATPTTVPGLSGVARLTHGSAFDQCVITNQGGLKCWGRNGNGAVGDGAVIGPRGLRDVVGLSSGVAYVAGGQDFTCAVTDKGGVKCWGDNYSDGQLGTDDGVYYWHIPADVSGLGSGGGAAFVPLAINKSDPTPYPPVAGQPVSYSIVVTNTSTSNLTNVTVTDVPGPGLGAMTAFTSSPAGTCNTTTHVCTLSSALAPGAVATFNVTFATPATAGVVINNTAYVNATEWQPNVYPDKDPLAAKTVSATNLAITKTASVTSATPGTPYSYTITVTNNGTVAATNVNVKDNLPANVTFNSATASGGGSCGTPSGGVLTCTWASLAATASATVTVNVTP